MATKSIAYTIFKNTENNNRVWVYWFSSKPEFVPGYWNIETEGIDNNSGLEWAHKMNEFVDALVSIGCSYKNIEATIRYTMVDGLGFEIIEDYDPKYVAA